MEFVLQPNGLFACWTGKDFRAINLNFEQAACLYGTDRSTAIAYLEKIRSQGRCYRFFCLVQEIARGNIKDAEKLTDATKR